MIETDLGLSASVTIYHHNMLIPFSCFGDVVMNPQRSAQLHTLMLYIGVSISITVSVTVWLLQQHHQSGHPALYPTRHEYAQVEARLTRLEADLHRDIKRLYQLQSGYDRDAADLVGP